MIEKKFRCRSVNRKCTNGPQVFHIARERVRCAAATRLAATAAAPRFASTAREPRACPARLDALDAAVRSHYAVTFMFTRRRALALVFVLAVFAAGPVEADDDATLFRVFLKDGTSLVSYGEAARVDSRVIFSMPTAATPTPPLHLVDIAVDRVDWQRTERYAAAARSTHYVRTRAENDYAALSNDIAAALSDVALT